MVEQTSATAKWIVMVACASANEARLLARAVVEQRLAACAQVLPGVESVYWWEGKVESATECLLILKTTAGKWDALEAAILAGHSYQVPEILALPIAAGLRAYLDWMDQQLP